MRCMSVATSSSPCARMLRKEALFLELVSSCLCQVLWRCARITGTNTQVCWRLNIRTRTQHVRLPHLYVAVIFPCPRIIPKSAYPGVPEEEKPGETIQSHMQAQQLQDALESAALFVLGSAPMSFLVDSFNAFLELLGAPVPPTDAEQLATWIAATMSTL
ncbi:unnamed protein product, partial [Ectocarpus sp. 8 AP-2014]